MGAEQEIVAQAVQGPVNGNPQRNQTGEE